MKLLEEKHLDIVDNVNYAIEEIGDYIGYFDSIGKKWATNEMIEECKNVINQIIDIG